MAGNAAWGIAVWLLLTLAVVAARADGFGGGAGDGGVAPDAVGADVGGDEPAASGDAYRDGAEGLVQGECVGETCAGDCVTGCAARPAGRPVDAGRDVARLALLALLALGGMALRRASRKKRSGRRESP